VIAVDALKCAQVKPQTSRHDPGKHHWSLAFRTWIALDCDPRYRGCVFRIAHCIPPPDQLERKTPSHPLDAARGAGDRTSMLFESTRWLVNIAHIPELNRSSDVPASLAAARARR
jgi:hypothetical protein